MSFGPEKKEICYDYIKLATRALLMAKSMSYVLVAFNYILRTIVIMVVTWIGYATQTA